MAIEKSSVHSKFDVKGNCAPFYSIATKSTAMKDVIQKGKD